jgi:hypothetical protein
MTLAERIALAVEASAALCAVGDQDGYGLHLGGPGERPETCHEMWAYVDPHTGRSASTCGLEVRACLREAGVDDCRLRAPYRLGMAISDLLAIASSRHALTVMTPNMYKPPELHRGDWFGVDLDKSDGHMGVCRSEPTANEDGSLSFLSGEGGQNVPGREQTHLREQRWVPTPAGWMAHALDRPDVVRRVTNVASAAKLETGGPMLDVQTEDSSFAG